mgnify:FL=1
MKKVINIIALALLFVSCSMKAKESETTINVIPYPQSVEVGKGTFKGAGANFNCDQAIDAKSQEIIKEFADKITFVSGRICSYATPVGLAKDCAKVKGFIFLKDANLAEEEYSIDITKANCIVRASSYNGFLYAIQTLKQLTSVNIFGNEPNPAEKFLFPCVKIQDKPRFGYRGMHLDCSRHFFSVEEVKKYLDIMALYKLNRFHWHLTDDQGWRVEIKKYPRLTEIGAFRNGTVIKKDWGSNDGVRYGGYYTQEQMKDIVAYAGKLGIVVIPEIDLPGHMMGALAGYPELGCTGGPYEVWTRWGISEQVLCPGKEAMFSFLEDVFTELMDIFPSEYIHIGGDECPKTEWEKCPACQARIKALGIKADERHTAEQFLQSYVTARVQKFLNDHGRKIIGWDEVLEGELAKGATVMSWRGTDGGIKASAMGFDVIMTPNTYCYFDYYQSEDQDKEPFGIGGFLPWDKVYSYEPLEGLNDSQQKHILGVQANLWTEYVATPEHLEYMLLPRMNALSEVQWCVPENKDIERFKAAMEAESFKIFDILGYNYRKF